MRYNLSLILFILLSLSAIAQEPIADKISRFQKANPSSNFFVHFDKNIYTNNEIAYFTGYLIKDESLDASKHQLMSVNLIRDIDSAIIVQDKFIMGKGISFGSINIPDSLLTGNYHFLAYTDRLVNGLPIAIFKQAITIKTNIDPSFKANLKILDHTTNAPNKQVLLSAFSKDNRFLTKPLQVTYTYNKATKKTTTDASGQVIINLLAHENISDPNLYVKLKNGKDSTYLTLPIPILKNKASVNFYPEGGHIVAGIPTFIGWEVKDQQHKPVAIKAFLYENDQVIDTIETSSYGIGKFILSPIMNNKYSVKLIHTGFADSVYNLPSAIEKGLVINFKNAITTDTLAFTIRTNSTKKVDFLIHNFKEVYEHIPFDITLSKRAVKIPLTNTPKGLMALTILDSLQRPLAERIFFAHHEFEDKIAIDVAKSEYEPREKVSLDLKLNTDSIGLVSIACVQDNRLDMSKMNDIVSFTYLKNELQTLPVVLKGHPLKDLDYLEQILLVKGWRKYNWSEIAQTPLNAKSPILDSLQMIGWFTKSKKELQKPITISALGSLNFGLVTTTDKGYFNFNRDELILTQNKKNFLFINDKNKLDYTMHIDDQFAKMSPKILKSSSFENAILPSTITNNADLVIKGNEKAIRLETVEIKSKNDNSLNFARGSMGANACGDYVCRFNILNCPNHAGDSQNTHPIPGRSYVTNGHTTIYQECKTTVAADEQLLKFNGIHVQKEFYVNDFKDLQEPAYFSTLYWNYGAIVNGKDKLNIAFYTGDITGKFRIIVQGISNKDVIYAERFFEVKPKKKAD